MVELCLRLEKQKVVDCAQFYNHPGPPPDGGEVTRAEVISEKSQFHQRSRFSVV
jgi:hypothetical protein